MLYCDINTLIAYSNNGFVNGDLRNGSEKAENTELNGWVDFVFAHIED